MTTLQFPATHSDFTIKWATLEWEIREAHALRRAVFCEEQKLFADSDQDDIDQHAQCIVAFIKDLVKFVGITDSIICTANRSL